MIAPGLLQLLQAAPTAARLVATARQAARGDPAALDYFRQEGWQEALQLVNPTAAATVRQLLDQVRSAAAGIQETLDGNVIEGEFSEVDGEPRAPTAPWHRYSRWLARQRWGVFVVLGPKGQGKTTLALRLAEVWHRETGWRVEGLNLYPEDTAPWLRPITLATLSLRLDVLRAHLGASMDVSPEESDPEDDEEDERPRAFTRSLESCKRRILVIDEASLWLGSSGADKGRRIARQAMAQARHLEWLIVYIGQLTQQMPLDLLLAESIFVKKPAGWEQWADRQEPLVRDLWARAAAKFATVERSPWWPLHPDPRAWAYVDCATLGGSTGAGWRGMMPFRLPGSDGAGDEEGES